MRKLQQSVRHCIAGTFIAFVAVMILFFREAAGLEETSPRAESFEKLWVYILAGLAFNALVALMLLVKYRQRGDCENVQKALEQDAVTKLDSFNSFLKRAPKRIKEFETSGYYGAVVIVSMDDFKKINSIGGYEAGNTVLMRFAEHLQNLMRDREIIARYFGDEIILLLYGHSKREIEERIIFVWEKSLKSITIKQMEYIVKVSVGAKVIETKNPDLDTIISRATTAKIQAKQLGGNRYEFYTDETDLRLKKETEIETALHHALENGEFYLVYQPIVDMEDHEIMAVEALLRWNHPKFGCIPIFEVIEIAEKKGLIHQIGEWVLQEACIQNKKWLEKGLGKMVVSVNVSPVQMNYSDFGDTVMKALTVSGLDPNQLQLEITESAAMQDVRSKEHQIRKLKLKGIGIAIDDFGTGYSSLSYFANLPVDNLKIDRSFILSMSVNKNAKMIVDTIIHMARGMKITTTAEGVEDFNQMAMLRSMGCTRFQGYLITEPLKAEDLEAFFKDIPEKQA